MRVESPIRYVSGSVVYGRGLDDGWACFALAPSGSDYEPVSGRLAVQRDVARFLAKVERDGQLVRLARQWDAQRYLEGRAERPSPAPAQQAAWVADQADELAHKCVDAALPRLFLAIRLSVQHRDLREQMMRGTAARRVRERFGVAGRMVRAGLLPDAQREHDQLQAQALLAQLHEYTALRSAAPASTADIQWWVRRVYARGLGDPRIDPADVPQGVMIERDGIAAVRPLEVDLLRWTGGVESGVRRPDHVVCSSPDGGLVVQQTLMATSWHPTADRGDRSLGLALVAPRGLQWPLDVAVSWEWHSNDASKRAMDRKSRETLEDARQEQGSQLGLSDGTGQAYGASHGLLARLETGDEPTLRAVLTASIAVEVEDDGTTSPGRALADAVRRLRERSRMTRDLLQQSCGVTFQVPPLQQVEAMQQMLPAQPILLPGYGRIVMPDQIAALGMTSGTDVGSGSGWVWARTASQRPMPVRLDLTDPARLNCAAGILWVGDSGGGKTFAAGAAMVAAALDDAKIVNSDPKGDHKWHRALPPEMVQEVRLDQRDAAQLGMLDPFIVAAEERRTDVATSFLRSLLPKRASNEMQIVLQEAVVAVQRAATDGRLGSAPTCTHVLERLGELAGHDPAAGLVHRALVARASEGLARLAFAAPGRTGITLGDRPITSIVSNSFVRPGAHVKRADWSDLEVVSMGLVEMVGHLTARLVARHRGTLKILNADEAHADLATDLGRGQIDSAQRMGRSELLVPSIATQTPSDLTDAGLTNLFGAYVLFRAVDERQARAALELAALDCDDEILQRLMTLPLGHALLRDYRRRTEWVEVLAPRSYTAAVTEQRTFEAADDTLAGAAR